MRSEGKGGVSRRLAVTAALHRAGLAAARTQDPEAIYDSVAASLLDVGFYVSIYTLEADFARLVRSSFGEKAVRVVERHTGLKQDAFSVPLANVPWFRTVLSSDDPRLFDTSGVLNELFPSGVRWLASPVARVLKIRRTIGARVLDERQQPRGLLFLLGDDLEEADLPTASVFAQLLSVTLGRARMTAELARHVAALHETQAQLLQAQKLEAIGQLTGGIAHDFNNLLTPALFAVGELEVAGLKDSEHHEAVSIIRQTLERCADLTRSLLAFGRRQMLARRNVVLDDAVGEALRLVRATFQEHVQVEWSPGAGGSMVNCDVTQLHQVLINLALNARDAMSAGGKFSVSTRATDDGWVLLECRDTGCGIAPEVLPRIFEPFFTTKGPGRGTGLGLSVVEGIVRQHEGTITVDSTPGKGTSFSIRLKQVSAPKQTAPTMLFTGRGAGQRLLVVEDDPLVRRTLVRILVSDGFGVVEAASLAEARELRARSAKFDLVVTDVVLSDGKSTEETLALARAGQKVLFVTGHPLDAAWLPVELARLPVLPKPFGPSQLLTAVNKALQA